MSTTIVPFDFAGQQVRVVTAPDGEPWFVARDACGVLDLGNVSMAVSRLAEDEKGVSTVDTLGGPQQVGIVSEAGLYRLIFTSRKAEAEAFRRWVTHTVLPSIRKTGGYGSVAVPTEIGPAFLRQIAEAMEAKDRQIDELTPRAEVGDRLMNADGDLSVSDAGKALTRAGVKVGERRLFSLLAGLRWVYRHPGDGRWRVYQAAIESGWMSVLPQSHYHPKTGVLVLDPPQPRITPKGLQRILRDHGAEQHVAIEAAAQLAVAR